MLTYNEVSPTTPSRAYFSKRRERCQAKYYIAAVTHGKGAYSTKIHQTNKHGNQDILVQKMQRVWETNVYVPTSKTLVYATEQQSIYFAT